MDFSLSNAEMVQIWKDNQEMLHKRKDSEEKQGLSKKDDRLLYLTNTISSIVDMAMECGQCESDPLELTPCERVVRIRRPLPMEVLRINHPEAILYGGVFIKVKGLLIPSYLMKEIGYYTKKLDIKTYKLPEWVTNEYMLGTLKSVKGYGFCFSKSDIITNYITYASAWEYLEL